MEASKRAADPSYFDVPPRKVAKLGEDRVASMPSGANIVEFDGKACSHEVCWPPGEGGSTQPPPKASGPAARQYPFKIDPFQQTAINCLEAGHNVLVAAHTSAGKTVVAEYAFAMALRDKTRVVYTSPLKALSNQKYRELHEEFGDVGLMTGDVTINPSASCLVMTTEVLRSMLYRGSEVVRELALVVYDEVHYLKDVERGVVWEESIVLMPKAARMVFLSATIPNAREFAGWIAATHGSPVHVVYTEYRPTPLQHYIFPAGADGLFMVVDEQGTFREDNFQKAVAALNDSQVDGKLGSNKGADGKVSVKDTKQGMASDCFKLVRMVMERNYDPLIVFSFSKRECESLALGLGHLDTNTPDEKALVEGVFKNAIDCLNEDDQRLPQITHMLPMLKRGIGVHHSGLLPVLKELVELLFQEGLLKVLFATETFSTGLNMPAKTVAFTRARKFDGGGFRWVSSGEYIQMSGRAGRRGIDDRGIVILMIDTKMEPAVAKEMIKGAADPMISAFHLRYSMLLALARVEGASPEALLSASYRQWQLRRSLPQLEARVEQLSTERDAVVIEQEDKVEEYLSLLEQYARLSADLRQHLNAPNNALRFLQSGRLTRVSQIPPNPSAPLPVISPEGSGSVVDDISRSVWGIIINFEKAGKATSATANGDHATVPPEDSISRKPSQPEYIVDILVNCDPATITKGSRGMGQLPNLWPPEKSGGTPMVVTFPLSHIDRLSAVRLKAFKDLRTLEARTAATAMIGEVIRRYSSQSKAIPLLDPEQDMKIDDKAVYKLVNRLEAVESRLASHELAAAPELRSRLAMLQHKHALAAAAKAAKRDLKAAHGLVLSDELKHRQRVLRRLGYVDAEGLISVKGRVAADLQTGDELVLTELLFNGTFNSLTPEQAAALCSCFVWQEKSEAGVRLREELQGPLGELRSMARRVGKVAAECKMPVDVEEYVSSFRHELMEPVAAWARGARFADVLKMADVFEGSLVRAVRRLDELMRQVAGALRGIGEIDLANKFDEAIVKIKRDVIFAASLYL